MPEVPLNFAWEVAKAGHRWLQTHAMGQGTDVRWHYLTPAYGTGSAASWRCATTRSPPSRACSATSPPPIPASMRSKVFADRFGLLGGNLRKRIVLHDQGRGGKHPMGFGEHVDEWVHEILVMRLAVDLWESARQGDADHLGRIISWAPDGTRVSINTHPELQRQSAPHGADPRASGCDRG